MKTVSYKGFQASVEYEDGSLYVRVLHIDDLLVAEVSSVAEIAPALEGLVEEYLRDCVELGREPKRPFNGTFNVRVGPDLHRKIAMAAAAEGETLNSWITTAVSEKIECTNLASRMDDVVKDARAELQLLRITRAHTEAEAGHPAENKWAAVEATLSSVSIFAMQKKPWGELNG